LHLVGYIYIYIYITTYIYIYIYYNIIMEDSDEILKSGVLLIDI